MPLRPWIPISIYIGVRTQRVSYTYTPHVYKSCTLYRNPINYHRQQVLPIFICRMLVTRSGQQVNIYATNINYLPSTYPSSHHLTNTHTAAVYCTSKIVLSPPSPPSTRYSHPSEGVPTPMGGGRKEKGERREETKKKTQQNKQKKNCSYRGK